MPSIAPAASMLTIRRGATPQGTIALHRCYRENDERQPEPAF